MEIPSGQAPLHVFAERSDAAGVLSELDAGVDPNLRTEWARETALSMCVGYAWRSDKSAPGPTAATVECVRLLLARGASPNVHGGLGARIFPLHHAARWASSEVLGMLLEAGAEVKISDTLCSQLTGLMASRRALTARNRSHAFVVMTDM